MGKAPEDAVTEGDSIAIRRPRVVNQKAGLAKPMNELKKHLRDSLAGHLEVLHLVAKHARPQWDPFIECPCKSCNSTIYRVSLCKSCNSTIYRELSVKAAIRASTEGPL